MQEEYFARRIFCKKNILQKDFIQDFYARRFLTLKLMNKRVHESVFFVRNKQKVF